MVFPMLVLLLVAPDVIGDEPLHPVGDLDSLPAWPKKMPTKMVQLKVNPPQDAESRRKHFAQRNSPENIKALCLKLHAALEPDARGLGHFRDLVKAGKFGDALDAYRAFFFAKLKKPEDYQAYRQNLTGYRLKASKKWVLHKVDPQIIDWAMQGIYTFGDLKGFVGTPGQISWVPHGLELPEGATYARSGNDHPFFLEN